MDKLNLMLVRERAGNGPDCFHLYACRGREPHCETQVKSNPSVPCASCIRTDETETIDQLIKRIERGDG